MRSLSAATKKNIALFLFTSLICFALAEIVLRLFVIPPPLERGSPLFHTMTNDSRRVWVMEPYAQGVWAGTHYKINSQGFRDHEYGINKPKNTFRIAIVGDSITFGRGVYMEETFSKLLEKKLQGTCAKDAQVLNFGVSAYNTEQEFYTVKDVVLNYSPDLILIIYFPNDPQDAVMILNTTIDTSFKETIRTFLNDHVYTYKLAARAYYSHQLRESKETLVDRYVRWHDTSQNEWKRTAKALERLSNLSKSSNIPLILFMQPEMIALDNYPLLQIHDQVISAATAVGIESHDLFPYFKDKDEMRLRVHPFEDLHPNAQGHNITAEAIFSILVNNQSNSINC